MQAPTTPTDPPVSQPDERACPACGAQNGQLAAFCWQCYRPFGPRMVPHQGGYAGPGAPGVAPLRGLPYASAIQPASVSRPTRSFGTIAGAVLLVVALGAGAFLFLSRGPSAELPTSFGDLTMIEQPGLDAVLDTAREQAGAEGYDVDMGFYGTAGMPSAALAWISGPDMPVTGEAFSELSGGFDTSLGAGSVDLTRRTSQSVRGVQYECVPMTGELPATMCVWDTDGVLWMLIDLSGSKMAASQQLAVAAHDAAV